MKLSLSHWYPGSGVVFECIDYRCLPSFLLLLPTPVLNKTVKRISLQYRAKNTNTSVSGDLTGYNDIACLIQKCCDI